MDSNIWRERSSRFRTLLEQRQLDGALIFKPQNICYLSKFNPIIQSHPSAVWVPVHGDAVLILHALRYRHAQEEAAIQKRSVYGCWGVYGQDAPADFWGAVQACFGEAGVSGKVRLGVEEAYMPVAVQRQLQVLLPEAAFEGIDDLLFEQRRVKDAHEIDLIEKAAGLADQGMKAAIGGIKTGATEAEVGMGAMAAMQKAWHDQFPDLEPVDFGTNEGGILNSLWAYCLSGPRMNLMCDSSKSRRIRDGDLVLVVIWTALNGYHAENERTVSVGPVAGEKARAFETVLQAREKAQKWIRPGALPSDIYRAAADVMIEKGYARELPGRIGHGIGLGAHEPFFLEQDNRCPLQEGMVMSFEPSIRIGEQGGVQHSDTIVITTDGFRYLTHTERGVITI